VAISPTRAVLSLEIRIDPEATAIRVVRSQVRSLMFDSGFRNGQIDATLLGLDEVLTNACRHGGAERRGEAVELAIELFGDRIIFEVRDRGPATPRNGRDAAALPDEDAESGRGLFLIHTTMDEVHFEPREGGGTRVRLVKRR
jgi:anti-sigma regulatory factor (Ser/Thr protein kinase)